MENRDQPADSRAQELADLQRLIAYVERRRAALLDATGGAFDRRITDATILLSKLWVAVMDVRLASA